MKVNIVKAVGFSPDENLKLFQAASLMEKVWNSHEFEEAVRNFTFPYKDHFWSDPRPFPAFRLSRGFSNEGVYVCLMKGGEILSPEADGEADIQLTIDRRNAGNVLGYTYSATPMQWIYSSFFGRATVADIAANLAHEYCHKLGFEHEFKRTASRQYTVPYAIGNITKRLAEEVLRAG